MLLHKAVKEEASWDTDFYMIVCQVMVNVVVVVALVGGGCGGSGVDNYSGSDTGRERGGDGRVVFEEAYFIYLFFFFGLRTDIFLFQITSHVLAYTNSCLNPLLYAKMSTNFR